MGCEGVKGGGKKRGRSAGGPIWVGGSAESDGEVCAVFIILGDDGISGGGSEGKSMENDRE
jgi:hypothetical protein